MQTSSIILIISFAIGILILSGFVIQNPPKTSAGMDVFYPESHVPDPICFVIDKTTSEACFPLSDFESLDCDRTILEFIYKHTNLLDEEFNVNYVIIDLIGLPEDISEEEYEKCADAIYEKRKSMSENMEFESFSIVEGTKIQLEGVIMDMRLGPDHQYSFFTNDAHYSFNTGSEGITLEGINNKDDLHGKIVKLSGTRTQRDLGIKVDELVELDSLITSPKISNPVLTAKDILDVSLDTLYENPDHYYNRFVRIAGELREHENIITYAGVGCDTAKYTTSDEFVSPSALLSVKSEKVPLLAPPDDPPLEISRMGFTKA